MPSRPKPLALKPVVVPLVSVALGVVLLLVAWQVAGDLRLGLWFLGIMVAFSMVLRFGQRFETVQILSRDRHPDERHGAIALQAIAWAYSAVITVAVLGFLWEIAQGAPGPFTLVGAVGGATHILATVVLRARR